MTTKSTSYIARYHFSTSGFEIFGLKWIIFFLITIWLQELIKDVSTETCLIIIVLLDIPIYYLCAHMSWYSYKQNCEWYNAKTASIVSSILLYIILLLTIFSSKWILLQILLFLIYKENYNENTWIILSILYYSFITYLYYYSSYKSLK